MIAELKLKSNCKTDDNNGCYYRSLSSFDLHAAELFIKYRTAVYEYASPVFKNDCRGFRYTPFAGVFALGTVDYLKGPFHTRMIFEKSDHLRMTAREIEFNRWIKTRSVMFFNAMLFVKDGDEYYELAKDRGPLHLPLLNKHYHAIVKFLSINT